MHDLAVVRLVSRDDEITVQYLAKWHWSPPIGELCTYSPVYQTDLLLVDVESYLVHRYLDA